MAEKTVKTFIAEFKQAFGEFEYTATRFSDGLVVQSKGYKAPPTPRLQINAEDYLLLANGLNVNKMPKTPGVISGLMKIVLGKK